MDAQALQYSSHVDKVYDYCNFGYYDLMNCNNFEQIINHIRGENAEPAATMPNYDTDQFDLNAALLVDHNQSWSPTQDHHLFDLMSNTTTTTTSCTTNTASDLKSVFSSLPPISAALLVDHNQSWSPTQDHLFDLRSNTTTTTTTSCTTNTASDLKSVFSSLPPISTTTTHEDIKTGEEAGENNDDIQYSSGTTTTTLAADTITSRKKSKADRSKTLSAERKRRGRMKDKLYSLRSLVPNITKMDKASIVGDAILYVQDLQMQEKQLKAEIAGLEASSSSLSIERTESSQSFVEIRNPMKTQVVALQNVNTVEKNIMKMDVFQVEERGYYVRLESNIGKGIAAALYRTLESLTFFATQNSNLSTAPGRFVLTATLINVRDSGGEEISLPNMKLWISKALLKQGFEFKSASASPSFIASL